MTGSIKVNLLVALYPSRYKLIFRNSEVIPAEACQSAAVEDNGSACACICNTSVRFISPLIVKTFLIESKQE